MDIIILLIGLVVGALLASLYWKLKQSKGQQSTVSLESFNKNQEEKITLLERVRGFEQEREKLLQQNELHRNTVLELNRKLVHTESQAHHQNEQIRAQKDYLEEVKKQTRSEFENLAQQILENKSKIFTEKTETSVENLLKPLREKLTHFEKRVEDNYNNEAKERYALKSEVSRLIELNEKMTQETHLLTHALKGDSKFQGDWGELVLERVLESSGLREGHEYIVQSQHESDSGDRFKPDVIVNLPENKHIIVDSKVSLKAYEIYCRTQHDAMEQALQLKDHIRSIYKHIDDLSEKHYAKLKGIKSPDFVFLFMPIEPAYLLAAQNDPDLTQKAWRKNVAIVTSTTLLTSLRTVASIWRLENQKKNADEIASEASKLYDKFVGFLEDFEDIGKTFQRGQTLYTSALGKLKEGPGNVFRKMELLRELGAEPNKRIKQDLLE